MKRERGLFFLVPEGRFSGGQEVDSWWVKNKKMELGNPVFMLVSGLLLYGLSAD